MLAMGSLKPGEFRYLSDAEVSGLGDPNGKPVSAAPKAPTATRSTASARTQQRPAAPDKSSIPAAAGRRPHFPKKNGPPKKP
jgi:hypothetical protein